MKRVFATMAVCLATALGMAVQSYMNYQGKLVQENGNPLPSGVYDMEINIYDAPQGGNKIWGPYFFDGDTAVGHTAAVSVMDGGTFNVIMGDKDTGGKLLDTAFHGDSTAKRYVELRINGGDPMLPRQQFLSAPYAFRAGRLQDVVNTSAGNVGIGTEAPAAKLDVNGNVKVATNLEIGGNAAIANDVTIGSDGSGNLTVNGNVTVKSDIQFDGKIVNFQIHVPPKVTMYQPGGTNETTVQTNLNLPADQWFCALGHMGGYISTSGGLPQYSCDIAPVSNSWILRAGADANGATDCIANCFKFR